MAIMEIFKEVYFNDKPLSKKDYYMGRKFFIFEGATGRTVFSLATGAFFAGFAEYMGASDQLNGILAAMPVLASFVQIFSPIAFEKLENRKFLISILSLFHRILLGLMVFIPLILKGEKIKLTALAVVYLFSFMLVSFITPAISALLIDLTPENIRGKYFGKRESYIIATATVVTLAMGWVMDLFKQNNRQYTGFLVVFIFILILAVINFCFISSVKEPPVKKSSVSLNIRSIIATPLKDKNFRKVIVLFFLWNMGLQIGGPFFSVYMVTGLRLHYSYIMLMSMISSLTNILTVRLWGKIADKKSWVFTTKMSIGLLAITHTGWLLVNQDTVFILLPLIHILAGIAWAGINISIFNIQFTFLPQEGRTVYLGFNAALNGVVGFTSTLTGSMLLGVFSSLTLCPVGIYINGIQLLFGISGLLLAVCSIYIHLKMETKHDYNRRFASSIFNSISSLVTVLRKVKL